MTLPKRETTRAKARLKPVTDEDLDGVERDLNKLSTPSDNILRRIIADLRVLRATGTKAKPPKRSR